MASVRSRELRHKVLVRASMRAGGPLTEVCVRDVSERGLMAQASVAPARGTVVEIIHAGQPIVGHVIWSKDRKFGIRTSDRVNLQVFVKGLASSPASNGLRARNAKQAIQVSADRSATLGRLMQFGGTAAFALAAAGMLASLLYDGMSTTVEQVSGALADRSD